MPSAAARSASRRRSPTSTVSAGRGPAASMRQMSSPMPAGSPAVSTRRGDAAATAASDAFVDEGLVAHAPEPELGLLLQLARPDAVHAVTFAHLGGVVVDAAVGDLQDVPAEAGAERFAHLADLERVRHLGEFGHEGAGRGPAEIAALGSRARVVRVELGQVAEALAGQDALAQLRELLAGGGVVHDLVGADEDMP